MSGATASQTGSGVGAVTANDRLKQRFGEWFWGSLAAATAIHFLLFMYFPTLRAQDMSFVSPELQAFELPPEVEIPPPPQQIARPARPVISSTPIDEDVTIAPTTFEANPIENLPPPPSGTGEVDISEQPVLTPYTVPPDLKNRAEVESALKRYYPPLLRDAGIGGDVLVWFFIDETGKVKKTLLKETSGHKALDEAAIKVAEIMEFTPALNRDKRVPVWVQLPITFRAN
ncbi:MAG TPA: TonB family protein [Longimicrobiales bacterium]